MSRIKDLYAVAEGIDDLAPVEDADYEHELAHNAYLIEKETIINKLLMLISDTEYQVYKDTLAEVVEFIKRGEI